MLRASTCRTPTTFDSKLTVFTDSSPDSTEPQISQRLTCVAANDNSLYTALDSGGFACGGWPFFHSDVVVAVQREAWVLIHGYNVDSGWYQVNFDFKPLGKQARHAGATVGCALLDHCGPGAPSRFRCLTQPRDFVALRSASSRHRHWVHARFMARPGNSRPGATAEDNVHIAHKQQRRHSSKLNS